MVCFHFEATGRIGAHWSRSSSIIYAALCPLGCTFAGRNLSLGPPLKRAPPSFQAKPGVLENSKQGQHSAYDISGIISPLPCIRKVALKEHLSPMGRRTEPLG